MRIMFVINALGRGGAERVFIDDANTLSGMGHDVYMCLVYKERTAHELLSELNESVKVLFLEASGPFDVSALRRMRRAIVGHNIETVLSTLNDANIMARFAMIGTGVRLCMREANDPRKKTWWQLILDIKLSFVPDAVITVTDDTRKKVLAVMPWLAHRTVVVHNAAPETSHTPRSWSEPFTFLFVGRFDTQKNPLLLIRAFAKAHAAVPCRLRMIGDGSLLPSSRECADKLGIRDVVTFCGALPHAAVLKEMGGAHAVVLSSLWEGCPNVVLEAMSQGLPTIATRVGGVPELVDETCGVVVASQDEDALAEAMKGLASDPNEARKKGDAARIRAGGAFSRAEHVRKLLAVLSST